MAAEFVGIELQLMGADGVRADLQNLDRLLKSLGGRRKFDAGLTQARRDVIAYRGELEKLKRTQKLLQDKGYTKVAEGMNTQIEATKNKLRNAQQAVREFGQASREAGRTFSQTFNAISSRVAHIGSSMQSIGNALTRFTSPFSRLTTGLLYGAGYKALNMATQGLSGAFERYDVMKTYEKSLGALGLDATEKFSIGARDAMTAIDNLNESVLGLPTGLDEIVAAQKVYAGATGEMVKSTKTAIAANNAFLASGMDSRGQRFMQKYLTALASGADLTTNQWQSMARIAPLAMRAVSEELGYASKDYQKFTSDLHKGKIAGEEFLNAFIKVGTEGKVQAAANVMKTTWSGLAANITNAFKRMGEGILKSFDEAFEIATGRNLIQNLLGVDANGNEIGGGIKHWINNLSSSIQDWIKANPNAIIDFFNDLKSIDVKGLLKGIAEGMKLYVDLMKQVVKWTSGRGLEGFGKTLVYMNLAGKSLTIMGGIIKGLRGPVAFIGALATKGLGSLGIFGKIASLFGGLKGISKAKQVADKIPSVSDSLKTAFSKLSGALSIFGTVALGAGTGWLAFKSFKSMVKDLKEVVNEINTMSAEDMQEAERVLVVMAGLFSGFAVLADVIGAAVGSFSAIAEMPAIIGGAITAIFTSILAYDFWAVQTMFQSFFKMTDYLKKALNNLNEIASINLKKGKIDTALGYMSKLYHLFDAKYTDMSGDENAKPTSTVNVTKYKDIIKAVSDTVESIKKTLNDLNSLPEITDAEIESATTKINSTLEKMKTIYTELMKPLPETDIKNGSEKYQRTKNEGIVKAVAQIISTVKQSVADLKELETVSVDLDAAKQNVLDVGSKMAEINTALNMAFGEEKTNTVYMGEEMGGGKVSMTYNEGATKDMIKKANNMKQLFEAFKITISTIREAYQSIMGKDGDMQIDSKSFATQMEMFTGEDGVITKLKEMFDQLVSGFSDSTVDIETPMDSFSTAIGSLKGIVTTLQEIGGIEFTGEDGINGVVNAISGVVTKLSETFNAEAIAAVSLQITTFVGVVNGLIEQVKGMAGMSADNPIDLAITFTHNITGKDEVVSAIEKANREIRKAVNEIRTYYPKEITISLIPRVRRLPIPDISYPSTGGYIAGGSKVLYRSGGGKIFKPRGTDTVPAMLTPGEYVHNRRAVNFFGIDFMQKVNRLDMRGAMNELLTRAGHLANVSRGTVVNNTYNNNQKVIQNISTNSPDFAFKSASRFAGAF